MNKKKILWIALLVSFIVVIAIIVITVKPYDSSKNNNSITARSDTSASSSQSEKKEVKVTKTELEDGTLYTFTDEEIKSDVVVPDNFFDTTINDLMMNYNQYKGKNIQVEGLYMTSGKYTFVGRYSTSNICPTCPQGYSYIEYILDKKIDANLIEEDSWIKVIGKLSKGRDASSNFQDYYYLNVLSIEVMKEKGQTTVNN